jgi:predicted transposase YdaD
MERRFDATLKSLLEDAPEDWPHLLGIADPHVRVIDADISTISGAADKVLQLRGPPPSILHFEFQSGPDASIPCSLNVYNSVLEKRHDLPVRSVLVLLSPRADLSVIDGEYRRHLPDAALPYRVFRYDVVRVWKLPVRPLLAGGLGTLPLAPISAVSAAELPTVLERMKKRLANHPDRGRVGRLWTAVYVLLGLCYKQVVVEQLLQGALGMKESVTYQAIVAEGVKKGRAEGVKKGRAEGAREELRKVLLSLGEECTGEPAPDWAASALAQIDSLQELESLAKKVLRVQNWAELLRQPLRPSRRKRRDS